MSDGTAPISPARFAQALESLPLDALHAKAAEIRNSIGHLKHSNEQMLPFADEGDQDCREAMFENLGVIGRMNERVELVRAEVEKRGMRWSEAEEEQALNKQNEVRENGVVETDGDGIVVNGAGVNGARHATTNGTANPSSGRLTDEQLRRQLEAQMGDDDDDDEEGVHL